MLKESVKMSEASADRSLVQNSIETSKMDRHSIEKNIKRTRIEK